MTALLLVLLAAGSSTASGASPTRTQVQHFSIEVPAGYELKDSSPPMIDFDLYDLIELKTKKARCRLYLGNSPKFPLFSWSGAPTVSRAPGREQTEFRSKSRVEGTIKYSGLTYKKSPSSPWTIVHYMAEHLSEGEVQLIERMIGSITVTRPHLD
jgi:hypothetical protein